MHWPFLHGQGLISVGLVIGVAIDIAVAVTVDVAIAIFDVCLGLSIGGLATIIRPAIHAKGAWKAYSTDKGSPTNSRSPSPACPSPNGEVVHVETDPGENHSHERSKYDVESMMSVVEPPRCSDEKCSGDRDEGDDHQRDRGRRGARAN